VFRRRRASLWPTGTYTDWRWPPTLQGYARFDWTIVPETDPTPDGYFWSHQFGLVGGEGGYVGLQTMGADPQGKIAIFSIWEAESSSGPSVFGPFSGEGCGQTARIPFPWRPGSAYRLSVATTGDGAWAAHAAGDASGEEQLIGRIRVPLAWGGLRDLSIMWTERYAGPMRSCSDLRLSSARFLTPAANDGIRPLDHQNHLGNPPGCPGSEIVDLADGVRQVMGEDRRRA